VKKYITHCLLVAFFSAVVPTAAFAQPRDHRSELTRNDAAVFHAFHDLVKKPSEWTVHIVCDSKEVALGTIVDANGLIVTKASELEGKTICKFKDGHELEAQIIGVHEACDLALLKVDAKNLTPVEWADSADAKLGRWLASVGPADDPVAIGVVSVATRKLPPARRGPDLTNSGYLGIALEQADGNPKISMVMPNTGASKAGVLAEDVILAIAGELVATPEAFQGAVLKHKPGDTIELKLKRGDKELELKVTLGKRPVDRGESMNRLGSELSKVRVGFPEVLQHDTVIKPTECGCPVVDLEGKAVGINIARAGRTESYAIPSELVQKLLPDLKSGKLAPKKKEDETAGKRAALEKKVTEAKTALESLEAEKAALEKKLSEARAAKEKAEADLAAVKSKAQK
jgi:serine protease Do